MSRTFTLEVSVNDILDQMNVADIREYLAEPAPSHAATGDMSDPVVRLAAIVDLRRLGYTVENGAGA